MARRSAAPLTASAPTEEVVLTAQQAEHLEWLVDPNRVGSKSDQAAKFGLAPSTVYRWEQAPHFRHAWDERVLALGGKPDRVQAVFDVLFEKALTGDTRSAELWLRAVGKLNQAQEAPRAKSARDLSDAELEALVAREATAERNRRALRSVGADA